MLYDANKVISLEEVANSNAFMEMMIVDDVLRGDAKSIKEFCESEDAKVLVESNKLRKPTLMRLSKADDAVRRTKLAVYALAKAANDPIYKKLKASIKLKKALTAKLMAKYATKGQRVANIAQKNYLKMAGNSSSDEKK